MIPANREICAGEDRRMLTTKDTKSTKGKEQ